MTKKMTQLIATILFIFVFSVQGYTAVVASYDYASALGTDPTAQGWAYNINATNTFLGGYDSGDGWRVVDGTSQGYAWYGDTLTAEESDYLKNGFTATWTFKMDADAYKVTDGTVGVANYYLPPNEGRQNDNALWIETDEYMYLLTATADASGNLAINDGTTTHVLTSGGGNYGYDTQYTITFTYDGTDGILSYGGNDFLLADYGTFGNNRIIFGAYSGNGQGSIVWYQISIEDTFVSNIADNIQPANGDTGVLPTTILEWSAPSAYTPTGYDVYFGTNPTATANPKVVNNALQTIYDPPGDLDFYTTYYWQVDTYDGGTKHTGMPWLFTTRPETLIKVACVGDSITEGYGISDPFDTYPAQLQALLGPNYDVRNYGKSSARVSHLSSKYYKTFALAEYNAAIAFEPDIVVFALGINDCSIGEWETNKPVFVADYKDLIDDFTVLPCNPKVYVGTLMPVFSPPYPYPAIYDNMSECDPLIAQVASEEGAKLIDLYTPLEPYPQYYTVDGLHPDENGAAVIAETVYGTVPRVHIDTETVVVNEEGPTSDTYTIVLGDAPQQDVIVTLNPSESSQIVLEVGNVETNTIIFTPANYDQPQTVTVTAVDDALYEAIHSVAISHRSSSVDGDYNSLILPDVNVNISDNNYYGKRVKVFLIGGQSNAAGSGLNTEYPALYQSPQTDVEFWVGGRLSGDNVPDYSVWDRPADTAFGPLQLGSGNYPAGTHSGFEMSLGRTLKDALPYDNIAIVKYGMSGSALERGLRSGDGAGDWDSGPPIWSPTESFDGVRYHVFKTSAVLPALQAIIDRGDMPEIAGMFWMQGETDAGNLTAANNYETNLTKLISAVRMQFSAPDMRFFIGRIRTVMGTYNGTVRTAMENVAASDPLTALINTDDLAVNADNVHYSAAGLVDMGERFANAYLSTLPTRGDVEPDGDIDLSDFSRVAEQWLNNNCGFCSGADLNSDLDVTFEDLIILTENWLGG